MPAVRVAIYTRKSVEKRLEQDFNSIDAQREAAEAFILSRRSDGWVPLPTRYDDGGYSGASTARPAFQSLMRDVRARAIDIVVVYRIDRLSRSQRDFLNTVDEFEKNDVRFVSLSEDFTTTTPQGRAMMSLLMVFAQLEREVTAERVRDKITATRRRGQWTGGPVPLGYDSIDAKLVVNEDEARTVQEIFGVFIETGSITATLNELRARCITNKGRKDESGERLAGRPFDKTGLRNLLKRPIYVGKIRAGDEVVDGQHEAIVDQATWETAQALLTPARRNSSTRKRRSSGALLTGLLRCGVCGAAMVNQYTSKGGRRYGYYVCNARTRKGADACPDSRASTDEMDRAIVDRIRTIGRDPDLLDTTVESARHEFENAAPELTAEIRRLDSEATRLAAERSRLVEAVAAGSNGSAALTQRLQEVEERHQRAAHLATTKRDELAALKATTVNADDLRTALAAFDPIWEQLNPRERAKLMGLLLEKVTYNATTREVSMKLRPAGIDMLAREAKR